MVDSPWTAQTDRSQRTQGYRGGLTTRHRILARTPAIRHQTNHDMGTGYVNTGLALFATDYPGTVDSVELWNETDIGTVGGTSGNWCPATGTLLGAYESMIVVVGPSISSTNPSLTA